MSVVAERWPFAFDPDDIEVHDLVAEDIRGVLVSHPATGVEISMAVMPTRNENLQAALRRLDREVRRRLATRE